MIKTVCCYFNGVLVIAETLPDGALPVHSAEESVLQKALNVVADHTKPSWPEPREPYVGGMFRVIDEQTGEIRVPTEKETFAAFRDFIAHFQQTVARIEQEATESVAG